MTTRGGDHAESESLLESLPWPGKRVRCLSRGPAVEEIGLAPWTSRYYPNFPGTFLSTTKGEGEFVDIVHPKIEEYLLKLTPKRDRVLSEMEALGESRQFPIVGPLVGRFLYALVKTARARRILEMGSGFGYSAYWFAMALGPRGKVILTEESQDNADLARRFLKRGGLLSRARIEVGDALQIIDRLPGTLDLIFIDVEKEMYPRALKKAFSRVKVGGLIVTDNALWSGRFL